MPLDESFSSRIINTTVRGPDCTNAAALWQFFGFVLLHYAIRAPNPGPGRDLSSCQKSAPLRIHESREPAFFVTFRRIISWHLSFVTARPRKQRIRNSISYIYLRGCYKAQLMKRIPRSRIRLMMDRKEWAVNDNDSGTVLWKRYLLQISWQHETNFCFSRCALHSARGGAARDASESA